MNSIAKRGVDRGAGSRSAPRLVLLLLFALPWAPGARAQADVEAFDGSFRLSTGEVVTGGYFVEGGQGRYLYLDTQGLARGGLFERMSDRVLRSVVPPDEVEIEFLGDEELNAIVWKERGQEPLHGQRVHPHESRVVRFASGDGTKIVGRLLLPACPGPHPLVISVHGSGPVDRHGGPFHTFFLQHGVAVLAYDKRGYTSDAEAWREPDLATLSADAAAALRFASSLPEIDPDRAGFFGSSQGGWVVPRAAVEAPETDFLVLRAGAALSELETHLHEVRQELRADGLAGLDLDHAMALRREIYETAMAGDPISETDALVAPYLVEPWYRSAFGEDPVSRLWSPRWWGWAQRNFAVAATPWLERLDAPVLWFLAERDENVPLVSTRAALEEAFAASPGEDHEIVVLKGALHSFLIPSPEGPPRFSPGFFDRMGAWLDERGLSNPGCGERVP